MKQAVDYLTREKTAASVMIKSRKVVSVELIDRAVDLLANHYHETLHNESDEDVVVQTIRKTYMKEIKDLSTILEKYTDEYPKKDIVVESLKFLHSLNQDSFSNEIILNQFIGNIDDLVKIKNEEMIIESFFDNQKAAFDSALVALKKYQEFSVLLPGELENDVQVIKDIIIMENPFRDIYRLSEPVSKINKSISELYENSVFSYQQELATTRSRINDRLNLYPSLNDAFRHKILEMIEKEEDNKTRQFDVDSSNVSFVNNAIQVLRGLEKKLQEDIEEEVRRIAPEITERKTKLVLSNRNHVFTPTTLKSKADVSNYVKNDRE